MCCQKFVKMGCISSKEINDTYPNVFKVINVDDYGNNMGSGLLEIRNFEIILYQKGKPPVMWPLRTLRRYGYDSDHFSFESGRRCRTGPGIFAFRCQRAEQLFNLLQSRIEVRDFDRRNPSDFSISLRRSTSHTNSFLLGDTSRRVIPNRFPSQFGTGRFRSMGNRNGNISHATSAPLIMDRVLPSINLPDVPENNQLYENDSVMRATVNQNIGENAYEQQIIPLPPSGDHSYANSFLSAAHPVKIEKWRESANEIKIVVEEDDSPSPEVDNSRLYMNILPETEPIIQEMTESKPIPVPEPEEINGSGHRVDLFGPKDDGESVGGSLHGISEDPSLPTSPRVVRSLNYIVLDLEQTGDPPKSPTSPNPSESGKRLSEGYTAIDFQKTVALSQTIHPDSDLDRDSCRKTRHSSNAFPHERHGSSVSD